MPPVTQKGSFVGKLGNTLRTAHEQHKNDETEYSGFSSLPGGIDNGIAQLIECVIAKVGEDKKMKGEYYFRATGIVHKPTQVDGIPIKGLRTTIMEMLCDTPESGGERKTFADHWAYVLNELRKLGLDTSTMDVSSDDGIQASLDTLVGMGPFFRFRTWQPPTPTTGPYANKKPNVVHTWQGFVEDYTPDGESGEVVDNTATAKTSGNGAQIAKKPKQTKQTTNNNPSTKPSPNQTQRQTKPTTTTKPVAPVKTADDIDPFPPSNDLPDDLDKLLALAKKKSEQAQLKLADIAKEAGMTEDDLDRADSWDEVVESIKLLQESSPEETTTVPTEEEEEFIPEVDQVWNYHPIDVKTNCPVKNPVACKVTKVDKKSSTVTLENLEDSRKTYTKVPFKDLRGDED